MDANAQSEGNTEQGLALFYEKAVQAARHRPSRITGRTLEEEADADRGRVLFSSSFRRLQNKAQVFSLERNASVRSRLTHSLEVASIGRYITQQTIKALSDQTTAPSPLVEHERAVITFVETACLLHDIGNPPFGHFGENAISEWFRMNAHGLQPPGIGGHAVTQWQAHYNDFCQFDGNPQGFRVVTKLHVKEKGDLCGMNLTATALASTVKYPWASNTIGEQSVFGRKKKKMGYYQTEAEVISWVRDTLGLKEDQRHPFVYLMEAADDVAYCLSDIEDGIEKRLFSAREMARDIKKSLEGAVEFTDGKDKDLADIWSGLTDLETLEGDPSSTSVAFLSGLEDFHAGVIRYLVRETASSYCRLHAAVVAGTAPPLLSACGAQTLLKALRSFAESRLYVSPVVRDRELTATATLTGLLQKYRPIMTSDRARFERALEGHLEDERGRRITGELALLSRLPARFVAVYREEVRRADERFAGEPAVVLSLERIHRIRLIVDYIAGMTDDFAVQMFKLVCGIEAFGH